MKRSYILLSALALFAATDVSGQSVGPVSINAAGGSAMIGTDTYEWSVGELAWISPTGAGTLTQGVLQPQVKPTSVSSAVFASQLQVFPNPASSTVNVQLSALTEGTLTYRLMDITGRLIEQKGNDIRQGTNLQQINIAKLAAATYVLQVSFVASGAQEETATYRIQKLQ